MPAVMPTVAPAPRLPPLAAALSALLAALALATCAAPAGEPQRPREAAGGAMPPASPAASQAEVETLAFRLLNRARAAEGRPPLARDRALDRLARAHSAAMRDGGFFAHRDPRRGGVAERAAAAGVAYAALAENLGYVEGYADPAPELHRRLMTSPGHRRNRLDRRFSRVGVGVARRGDAVWLTEVFLAPPPTAPRR